SSRPAALAIRAFGPVETSVRLPSVLLGTAAVPLVYLLGRRWFGPFVGLLAAALLATWHYSIHFGRLGVSNVADMFFAALAFWLVDRAVATDEPMVYVSAAFAVGLGWHAYPAARLVAVQALMYAVESVVRQPA